MGGSVSWVAHPVFYSLLAELAQHRKWYGVASFFGIVVLGTRKPFLAQGGYVCWWRCWISLMRDLARLYQQCLSVPTTSLGMLQLGVLLLGGHVLHKVVKRFLEGWR